MIGYTFWDVDHANRYLEGTIIRVEDEPVYVRGVTGRTKLMLHYYLLTDVIMMETPLSILLNNEAVNLEPFEIGMINYKHPHQQWAIYGARIPRRAWKIGLTPRCLSLMGINRTGVPRANDIIFSQSLCNTIKGIYPSFEEAHIASQSNRVLSMAFSRRFAISGNEIFYRTIPNRVGQVENNMVVLDAEYFYLLQQAEEDGVPCTIRL